MELVVYIAIMGIIVIVAGQAFSNSTKFRVRNQSMIEANEVAGNIASLIKDDIAQMGAKSAKQDVGTGENKDDKFSGKDTSSLVYIDVTKQDSSSFTLVNAENGSSNLKFRRIHYDNAGKFVNVEEVNWFLDGDVLRRTCSVVGKDGGKCADSSSGAVEIAKGVSQFSLMAGKPGVKEEDAQMFPTTGDAFMLVPRFGETHYNFLSATPANSGKRSILSGFASNFDKVQNKVSDAKDNPENTELNQVFAASGYVAAPAFEVGSWNKYCKQAGNFFTFEPNMVYEISFEVITPSADDQMGAFSPGQDYLSVGFRNEAGAKITGLEEDFLFYPPITEATEAPKRAMRFSVGKKVTGACLVFTFASYSPTAPDGTITIQNLKLKQLATANYEFTAWNTEATENIAEKKNVKAFKLSLSVKVNGEEGVSEEIISVPSNGLRD